MKRIAFVVEGYIGQSEANAICLKGIIESLGNKVLVDIFSIEKNVSGWNKNVYAINKSKADLKNETVRKLIKFLHMPVGSKKLSKLIFKETNTLLCKKDYDALIVVVNPVEAADAIKHIKKKNPLLKVILYEIDPPTNRYKVPKSIVENMWKWKAIVWAKKVYSVCDTIIHMKSHEQHFSQRIFLQFGEKTKYLDIPNFRVSILPHIQNDTPVLVYAGAFYPELRNPFPMLNVLKILSISLQFEVHIYTGINMLQEIRSAISECEMIHIHEFVSQEELIKQYTKADFLLDLGNTGSDYLPSKPFQYMGTGKPIIHFKPDNDDVTVEYLKKYKDALIVSTDGTSHDIDSILRFIKLDRSNVSQLTRKELLDIFYENTPEYTAERLLEIIEQ